MICIVKVCIKHGELRADETHRENNKSRKGYLIRCNQCKLDKDRRWKETNREKHNSSACTSRNLERKLYREGISYDESKANIWAKDDRKNDREKYREYERRHKEKIGRENYNRRENLRNHGLTLEKHDEMINSQNNLCAICDELETRGGRTKGTITPLCIDHCHECREKEKDNIRGLLCHSCNTALGKFKDNVKLMKKAILYLEKHKCS